MKTFIKKHPILIIISIIILYLYVRFKIDSYQYQKKFENQEIILSNGSVFNFQKTRETMHNRTNNTNVGIRVSPSNKKINWKICAPNQYNYCYFSIRSIAGYEKYNEKFEYGNIISDLNYVKNGELKDIISKKQELGSYYYIDDPFWKDNINDIYDRKSFPFAYKLFIEKTGLFFGSCGQVYLNIMPCDITVNLKMKNGKSIVYFVKVSQESLNNPVFLVESFNNFFNESLIK